jgi:hypothetical protein
MKKKERKNEEKGKKVLNASCLKVAAGKPPQILPMIHRHVEIAQKPTKFKISCGQANAKISGG